MRWFAMYSPENSPLPFLKYEERASGNQREADEVIPADRLLQVDERKAGEHQQRDHLLHRFELRCRIDGIAETVRRNRKAVFDERDAPAREDDAEQRHLLEAEMAVPRDGHRLEQISRPMGSR